MYEEVESEENDMSPIVYVPPKKHECEPPEADEAGPSYYGGLYPDGTIWACDDCGSLWELEHEHYGTSLYGDGEGQYATIKLIWNTLDD